MAYNILEGGEGRIDPLAEVIRLADADVVMVAEAWDEGLFHRLADRVGMDRFRAENPRNPEGAVGVLSRLKIVEGVNHAALDGRFTKGACHVIVEVGSLESEVRRLPIVGVHLHARETVGDEAVRMGELPGLFAIGELFRGRGHVMAGDFNAYHPQQIIDMAKLRESTKERISKQGWEVPRDVVRAVLERGYVDTHGLHFSPGEFGTSFTTSHPGARVDYVFVSAELGPRVKSSVVFKPEMARFASDHYPVVCELEM
ncbi:MAG TPA: endonuclease/exonuclease/phosphatase family protein [Phycisphaerae bacterium]|nr:endonuclease/exonuclease/phosphatase family protein [Phycisphaerae bacterium]